MGAIDVVRSVAASLTIDMMRLATFQTIAPSASGVMQSRVASASQRSVLPQFTRPQRGCPKRQCPRNLRTLFRAVR